MESIVVADETYWCRRQAPAATTSPRAHLLPAFDEYVIAYRDRAAVLDGRYSKRLNAGGGMISPTLVIDGRIVGIWRRTGQSVVSIEAEVFEPLSAGERLAVTEAARRYGRFLNRSVRLDVVDATARSRRPGRA
jgi:hypothetical protein